MGTPEIARAALIALLRDGHEVAGVYTRADKPVGRHQTLEMPPVKKLALENGIPVLQPATLRTPGAAGQLAALKPELVVVVAYGMLLPKAVLEVPAHGCINLHVSLLPKYRGAAPIQWAVINGEQETGVSIMQLDAGMDTGPVLATERVEIPPHATAGEMFEEVTGIGARLLAATVQQIAAGKAVAVPQSGEATLAPMLKKSMAQMDFAAPAKTLHNLVRGCNPWPVAWFTTGGKRVRVQRSHVAPLAGAAPREGLSLEPLTLACGEGALALEHLQPEGGRVMTGTEWAAGRRLKPGGLLPE